MRSLILIGAALLLLAVGIVFRVNATSWSTIPVPGQPRVATPGTSLVYTIDPPSLAAYSDVGNALCLMGLIAFTVGIYGWMADARATPAATKFN